jgi:hypothetical protein
MMPSIQRRLVALAMTFMMLFASVPALAGEDDGQSNRPSASAMIGDAAIARPVLLVMTVTGVVLFVATLPFSLLGGNVGEAGKMLVVGPAKSTFLRCLGCTSAQDDWKHQEALTQNANKE